MLIKSIKKPIDYLVRPFIVFLEDYLNNQRYKNSEFKFLVVHHGRIHPSVYAYHVFLNWIETNFPDIRPCFELHQLPCRISDWSKYKLHLPWLQDPVQQWSLKAYKQACKISSQCDELNIPTINRVENLINASKSNGARLIGSVGIRTPKIVKIIDINTFKRDLGGLELPLIIRDDWVHGGKEIHLIETMKQLNNTSLNKITRPIAIEFINTRSKDGLYRKYRYTLAGEKGFPQSIHVRKHWEVRGNNTEFSDALVNEEKKYLHNFDPNHDQLLAACKALKLDFVAFDYSYDPEGKLVVWEANPFPYIHVPGTRRKRRAYRWPAVKKLMAGLLQMYLTKADMDSDYRLERIINGH